VEVEVEVEVIKPCADACHILLSTASKQQFLANRRKRPTTSSRRHQTEDYDDDDDDDLRRRNDDCPRCCRQCRLQHTTHEPFEDPDEHYKASLGYENEAVAPSRRRACQIQQEHGERELRRRMSASDGVKGFGVQ
jgi:hypothetical protein